MAITSHMEAARIRLRFWRRRGLATADRLGDLQRAEERATDLVELLEEMSRYIKRLENDLETAREEARRLREENERLRSE